MLGSGDAPEPAPTGDDPGRLTVEAATGIVMVLLPGGSFDMGAPGVGPTRLFSAQPRHPVVLAPYYVSKYELTVAQARRLGAIPPDVRYQEAEGDTLPLRLDWSRSRSLLQAYGLDHPTEAQWEYAALGGQLPGGPTFEEGGVPDERFVNWGDENARILAVGSRLPNRHGLYDMAGNVSEWCREWMIGRGYSTLPARPGDGLMETAFRGPGRIVRGGSTNRPEVECDPFQRTLGSPLIGPSTGCRPVLPAARPSLR